MSNLRKLLLCAICAFPLVAFSATDYTYTAEQQATLDEARDGVDAERDKFRELQRQFYEAKALYESEQSYEAKAAYNEIKAQMFDQFNQYQQTKSSYETTKTEITEAAIAAAQGTSTTQTPVQEPTVSQESVDAARDTFKEMQAEFNEAKAKYEAEGTEEAKQAYREAKDEMFAAYNDYINEKNELVAATSDGIAVEDSSSTPSGVESNEQSSGDDSTSEPSTTPEQPDTDVAEAPVPSTDTGVSGDGLCKVDDMGMNLVEDIYFSPEMVFRDITKVAAPMARFDGVPPSAADLDENGYFLSQPPSKVYTYLTQMTWSDLSDPKDYVLLYDGSAKITFFPTKPEIISSEEGRIQFRFNTTGQLKLQIEKIASGNHLRNIRIIPLEDENNSNAPFVSARFKELWGDFGTYRYLDPMRINGSNESEWSERTLPEHFGRGSENGMPLEDIVKVSNETKTNAWVLIPHLATNEYIQKMAAYLRDNLDNDLKVYIEYTNEPWNYQFSQSQWLLQKAGADFQQQPAEYGSRAKEKLAIFANYFGDSDRLVRVFNAQFWNTIYIKNAIARVPNLMEGFDAIGLGYYIGNNLSRSTTDISGMSDDDIIDFMLNEIAGEATEKLQQYNELASEHGVDIIAYEAGQHLVGARDEYKVQRFAAVNNNERMKDVYLKMAEAWGNADNGLIVWFNSAWDVFGTLESQGQDTSTSPKYQALEEILSRSGC